MAVAAILIAVSLSGGSSPAQPVPIAGAAETAQLLSGVPQQGTVLGRPDAPYRLVEYSDFQCPYCGRWAREVLPALIRDRVRSGQLQIEYRGLAFVGPDSLTALKVALAASPSGRFWNVADLLFRNQGQENSGWVTDGLLRSLLAAVPGLDRDTVLAARDGQQVSADVQAAEQAAGADGVNATPTFLVGPRGGNLQPLTFDSLDSASFERALDAALAG